MSTRLLTEMSGSTDILCSSFQSQSAHFLFFLHRVPEIRDTGAEWPKNLPKHSGSDKKPRIFGIQILFGIDAYNSAGLPPVSSSLRISQVFILLKKSPFSKNNNIVIIFVQRSVRHSCSFRVLLILLYIRFQFGFVNFSLSRRRWFINYHQVLFVLAWETYEIELVQLKTDTLLSNFQPLSVSVHLVDVPNTALFLPFSPYNYPRMLKSAAMFGKADILSFFRMIEESSNIDWLKFYW